jgi:translation initiation factor IF-3
MTPEEAILKAEDVGLDLVEVAPNSRPPVCRIMDYGKFKYEAQKKKKQSKGKSGGLKEVKLRPRTDDHDLLFKVHNARKFLVAGNKVKITLMYRGREMVHRELGWEKLKEVQKLLQDISTIESNPRMEGRFLSMMLAPNAAGIAEAAKKAELEAGTETEVAEPAAAVAAPESAKAE